MAKIMPNYQQQGLPHDYPIGPTRYTSFFEFYLLAETADSFQSLPRTEEAGI
jgi:hypothetical protein